MFYDYICVRFENKNLSHELRWLYTDPKSNNLILRRFLSAIFICTS